MKRLLLLVCFFTVSGLFAEEMDTECWIKTKIDGKIYPDILFLVSQQYRYSRDKDFFSEIGETGVSTKPFPWLKTSALYWIVNSKKNVVWAIEHRPIDPSTHRRHHF